MLSLCPDPNPPRIDETEGCTRDGAVRGRLVKLMLVQQASYESPCGTEAALEQDAIGPSACSLGAAVLLPA